jgi:hypothetical protein
LSATARFFDFTTGGVVLKTRGGSSARTASEASLPTIVGFPQTAGTGSQGDPIFSFSKRLCEKS